MSWSTSVTVSNGEVEGDISVAQQSSKEHHEQVDSALDAALSIIATGAVGNPAGDYMVYLNGHANENHEPRDGWANSSISISISQKL